MTSATTDNGQLVRHLVQAAIATMAAMFVAFLILFNFTDFF